MSLVTKRATIACLLRANRPDLANALITAKDAPAPLKSKTGMRLREDLGDLPQFAGFTDDAWTHLGNHVKKYADTRVVFTGALQTLLAHAFRKGKALPMTVDYGIRWVPKSSFAMKTQYNDRYLDWLEDAGIVEKTTMTAKEALRVQHTKRDEAVAKENPKRSVDVFVAGENLPGIIALLSKYGVRMVAQGMVSVKANEEVKVGMSWESAAGTRRVVAIDETKGLAYIQTGDSRSSVLLPLSEVFDEIKFDTKQLDQRQRMKQKEDERVAKEAAEKSAREDTHGFADKFSPMQRQKVINALLRQVRHGGSFMPVKTLVENLYREGWQVKPHAKFKQIAESPDGRKFMEQRVLTKTGLEYLQYLRDKKVRVGAGRIEVNADVMSAANRIRDDIALIHQDHERLMKLLRSLDKADKQLDLQDFRDAATTLKSVVPMLVNVSSRLQTSSDDIRRSLSGLVKIGASSPPKKRA